ncbi:hypothetical protein D0Z07_3489 [Hyphodiscus hymeniophilus]|uniref:Uncharacterized protein n=1 Tax=Hyphodiscus hymeniophilus TaxID=353542 RepID=A0A9P6VL10_9HELO|nr:hypothetical protein D0Z07_3489 [Hyphodiscus hymeniophilus]
MASAENAITAASPPWKLKATVYSFMMYVSAKHARVLSSGKAFLYSPLEATSPFAKDKLVGGLGMVQVIRYSESPVGPYDELLIIPGAFEYDVEVDKKGKTDFAKKKNLRITKIYVSQKKTCWNGRINWNIPKHLARFSFTNLPNGAIAIAVYPNDRNGSPSESTSSSTPIFSAIYKQMSYLPSFPISTGLAKYVGLDISLVQPPLPEGKGSVTELPGTQKWCHSLPLEYSQKTSLGWWDLKQGEADEEEPLLERPDGLVNEGKSSYENFWPGMGRWRIGIMMEDATIEFPEGRYWDGPEI